MSTISSYFPFNWGDQSKAVAAADEGTTAKSTFDAATPYVAVSITAQVIGTAIVAATVEGSALFLLGAAVALLGYKMFLGIIAAGMWYAGDPAGFEKNIGKVLTVVSLMTCVDILWDVYYLESTLVSDLLFSRLFSAI